MSGTGITRHFIVAKDYSVKEYRSTTPGYEDALAAAIYHLKFKRRSGHGIIRDIKRYLSKKKITGPAEHHTLLILKHVEDAMKDIPEPICTGCTEAHRKLKCYRQAVDDVGIYPVKYINGDSVHERTEREEGWNAAILELSKLVVEYMKNGIPSKEDLT